MDDFYSETLNENLERAYTALRWAKVMAEAQGLKSKNPKVYSALLEAIDATHEVMEECGNERAA